MQAAPSWCSVSANEPLRTMDEARIGNSGHCSFNRTGYALFSASASPVLETFPLLRGYLGNSISLDDPNEKSLPQEE